jgi:hypothetical protein
LIPSTMTSTFQDTELLSSLVTRTMTSYTTTTTSTSTSIVYTTVTNLGSVGASNPLVHIGFLSLLAVSASHRVMVRKGPRILRMRSLMEGRCSRS